MVRLRHVTAQRSVMMESTSAATGLEDSPNPILFDNSVTRREFVRLTVAGGVAVGAGTWGAESKRGEMIYRALGRTGEQVSALGLGGSHVGKVEDEAEAIRIIRSAIDRGLTFMDNSWDYNDGRSETI